MPSTRWSSMMLAAGVGLLAAAFFGPQAEAGQGARGGTLRVNSGPDFGTVDPALNYASAFWGWERLMCATLLWYPDTEDASASRPAPEVAAAMPDLSRDGRTYTFKLKRTYRFSTGERVTAHSFAHAWNRAMSPKLTSPAQHFLDAIEGAQAVFDGKAETATGIQVLDDWTLRVRLTHVAPDFLARMTMPFFCPLPSSVPADKEIAAAPVPGSGPYYLKEWERRRFAQIVRNPYYRGPRQANVDEVAITFGVGLEASVLQVEKGEADLGGFPPEAATSLFRTYGINRGRFFVRPTLSTWYFAFNHNRPLFRNNDRLKRAINVAIDRPMLTRQHGYLAGKRTDQILPPGMPGFRDWDLYSLKRADPARARSMLREGDLRGGKATLITARVGVGPLVAQVLQYNLKQIGIDLEIRLLDPVVWIQSAGKRDADWDIVWLGWTADYPDPSNFINVLFMGGENIKPEHNTNHAYFDDPTFNRRMREAALLTGEERYETFSVIERDLMRGPAPWATYVNTQARILVSPRVKNFHWSPAKGTLFNLLTVS